MATRTGRRQQAIIVLLLLFCIWAYREFLSGSASSGPDRRHKNDLTGLVSSKPPMRSKHLVVATLKGDDTSWIQKRLKPEWGTSIYVANDRRAKLTVPINKGREAMIYLT